MKLNNTARTLSLSLVLVLSMMLFAFSPNMTTEAQVADGCDLFNGPPIYSWSGGDAYYPGPYAFQAGETIYYTITGSSSVYASIFSVGYSDFGFNTTIQGSYTFTADIQTSIDFGAYNPYTVLDVSCNPPVAEEEPEVIEVDDTVYPPDARINWRFGDLHAILYRNLSDPNNPTIDAYCWDGSDSWLGLRADASTASGTSVNGCDAAFYVTPQGYQFNINFDGKLYEIRCEDFYCFEPDMSYYDPNE